VTDKLFYRVDEACEALALNRSTFYEQVRLGNIRIVKLGARTLVPVESLEAFAAWLSSPDNMTSRRR
jgi:excisionase family DNA binding protein